jgi:hypothetical protein
VDKETQKMISLIKIISYSKIMLIISIFMEDTIFKAIRYIIIYYKIIIMIINSIREYYFE